MIFESITYRLKIVQTNSEMSRFKKYPTLGTSDKNDKCPDLKASLTSPLQMRKMRSRDKVLLLPLADKHGSQLQPDLLGLLN